MGTAGAASPPPPPPVYRACARAVELGFSHTGSKSLGVSGWERMRWPPPPPSLLHIPHVCLPSVSPLPSPSLPGPLLSALPGLLSQLDPGLGVISVHRLILRGTDPQHRHRQNRAASLPSKRSAPAPPDALCWPLSLSALFCPGWRRDPQSPAQPSAETQAEAGRAPAPARCLQQLVIKNRPSWLEGMVFKDGRTP